MIFNLPPICGLFPLLLYIVLEGCGKMMWLFFMFLIFNPFLNFVTQSGAFDALLQLLEPLIGPTGKVGFTLLTVLVGIFGINGAAVAQAMMIDSLFSSFLPTLGISMELWGMIVLIGHQITSFAYPGVDMIGQMGLAHASNIKPMMKLSYFAISTVPQQAARPSAGSCLLLRLQVRHPGRAGPGGQQDRRPGGHPARRGHL